MHHSTPEKRTGDARFLSPVFTHHHGKIVYADIPVLRRQVAVFMEQQQIAPACRNKFLLTLSEILTNLVKHPERKAKNISITLTHSPARTVLDIADDSTPFATFNAKCNSAESRMNSAETMSESGYGLGCILRQHADVCYVSAETSADGKNHFTISETRQSRKTVFLIDDNPVTLKAAHHFLADIYDVIPFHRAADAVALFRHHKPHLVISDLNMPGMDGIALRQALSRLDGGNTTPFIFLSADRRQKNCPQISRLGIDDFLFKPVDRESLLHVAARLMTRSEQLRQSIEGRFHKDLLHALRPELPVFYDGWRIALCNRMADAGGGDFTLHHERKDCMLAVIADVMGHGVQAKFFAYAYAGYLRSLFRLSQNHKDAAHFLARVSRAVIEDSFLESVTMTCQSFQLFSGGKISIASAGHPPPILLTSGGCRTMDVFGAMPGLARGATYTAQNLTLSQGDKIIFATDGFFDAMPEKFIAPVLRRLDAQETAEALWQDFIRRTESSHYPTDDATLIVAEYGG